MMLFFAAMNFMLAVMATADGHPDSGDVFLVYSHIWLVGYFLGLKMDRKRNNDR